MAVHQSQRTGRRLHLVVGSDVVFEKHRDSVQRPAYSAATALVIELRCDGDCVRVELYEGMKYRVQTIDPVRIGEGETAARERTRGHQPVQLRNCGLKPGTI